MDQIPDTLQQVIADFLLFLPKLLSALVIFALTLYLANLISSLIRRLMERRRSEPGTVLLVFLLTRWGVIILGMIYALQQVEFQLTAFLAGLGIIGFTIGFALQDISQNIVAGLLLLIQRPFEIGDLIKIDDYTGRVRSIDLRATELYTQDGQNVLIPNAKVFTTAIINYNRQATWRISLNIGVAYNSQPVNGPLHLWAQLRLDLLSAC
jgi:small conductance mechanosensitive channel